MPDLMCSGPGPHEPPDGILGTADSVDATVLCPQCAALNPAPIQRPPLDPSVDPDSSPRDLAPVRERTI